MNGPQFFRLKLFLILGPEVPFSLAAEVELVAVVHRLQAFPHLPHHISEMLVLERQLRSQVLLAEV